jgi:hypothetical protein
VEPSGVVGRREDQRVVRELGVQPEHDLAGPGDGTDVVHVGLDRGRVRRVVVEVDPALGHPTVGRPLRDDHVVRPEHPALGRQHPAEVLRVGLVGHEQRQHVAGPGHREHRVATGHDLDIRVAGDLADIAGLDGLVDLGEGILELFLGERGGI